MYKPMMNELLSELLLPAQFDADMFAKYCMLYWSVRDSELVFTVNIGSADCS